MTPPRTGQPVARTALALALLLAGCGAPPHPSPVAAAATTWAIPTVDPIATQPAAPSTSTPPVVSSSAPTTASVTTPSTAVQGGDPAQSPVDSLGQDDTTAQPGVRLLNPTFDLDHIPRTNPAAVTWAYLTHRLTYSHTDTGPGVGIAAAAQYAATDLTADLAQAAQLATDSWPDIQAAQTDAIVTITNLTTFTTPARSSVVATWTLTVTTDRRGPRTTEGLSTTVVLTPTAGDWQVVTDDLSRPD